MRSPWIIGALVAAAILGIAAAEAVGAPRPITKKPKPVWLYHVAPLAANGFALAWIPQIKDPDSGKVTRLSMEPSERAGEHAARQEIERRGGTPQKADLADGQSLEA